MANYNKSFNFRNGVQVDEDDLIVRSSLVGIGTTIPRAELDVRGVISSSGLVTTQNLYVSGIATFNDVKIGTGITIYGNTGVIDATFIGNGAGLYNIPTSQWVDVDPAIYPGVGIGYSSIWAGGTVGIGTTIPRSWLQIGGDPGYSQNGVGISSTGNINATGIVTAGSFVGSGSSITNIDASNIASGTLDNARLPSNFTISGIVTFGTVYSTNSVVTGIATVGLISATNAYSGVGTILTLSGTNLFYTTANLPTLYSNTGIVTTLSGTNVSYTTGNVNNLYSLSGVVTSLSGTNLSYTGIATVGLISATNAYSGVGTILTLSGTDINYGTGDFTNINVTGIGTIGMLTASSSNIGYSTAVNLNVSNIRLGFSGSGEIDTTTGNLTIDSNGGTVVVDDNLSVSGISSLTGQTTFNTGLVADTSAGAYLGQPGQEFSEAYIDLIQIGVGVGNENKITTGSGNLILDANTNNVVIDSDLSVTGIASISGNLDLGSGILPSSDLAASLGSAAKRFSAAYLSAVRVGVAQTYEIDTVSGTELVLNSSAGNTRVNDNLFVSGIGSFSGELTVETGLFPDTDKGASLGNASLAFSEAYLDNITIGVTGSNEINTVSGNLTLDSNSNLVNILSNLYVSGISTLDSSLTVTGVSTFNTGILPDSDKSAYLGSSAKSFSEAHINEVTIGYGGTNVISTRTGALALDSSSNLVQVQANFEVLNNTTLSGNTVFGNGQLFAIDSGSNRVGIGTSIPETKFQVRDTNNLNVEFRSTTSNVKIGVGQSAVGAGRSTGYVGYAATVLSFVNEDRGGINFILHSGSAGVSTGNFNWIYGQTPTTLMSLDYVGKLSIGNNFQTFDSEQMPATLAISTCVGYGTTALFVEGETRLLGRTEIVGIVSVTGTSPENGLFFDTTNGTLTIKNLVVEGTTSGVTGVGAGITVLDGLQNYGIVDRIDFGKSLTVYGTSGTTADVGVSTTLVDMEAIGVGTAYPTALIDLHPNNGYENPCLSLSRISSTVRDSYTTYAYAPGSLIWNTTTNRLEVYTGTGWAGISTIP